MTGHLLTAESLSKSEHDYCQSVKFGKAYWEENRIHRNNVVSIRKRSIANYFSKNCSRKDKTFWSTVSPFMTDKKNKNGGKIILQEGDETITNNHQIANIFNDYFF